MAQLDRLLTMMVSNRAESIELVENEVVQLLKDGTLRPITKNSLTVAQLFGLVGEIGPPDFTSGYESSGPHASAFGYTTADGAFVVRVRQEKGRWRASLAIDDAGDFSRGTGAPALPAPHAFAGSVEAPLPPGHVSPPPLSTASQDGAAARAAIEQLLRVLVDKGASDLHLRCGEPPIVRMDGEMIRLPGLPAVENALLEAMLRSIMPERNQREYQELNDTDFAYEIAGVARFRANALRERHGGGAVFRVIPAGVVTVEQLGIPQELQNLCFLSKGLVLVTGPTGSGKSTTLCALIDLVNRMRTDHVITIEDPIEFVHPSKNCLITQRQVGVHTSSFKSALRAALREDPDIILVGELRDLETVSIAIETAETGHLVFGTLHTTTASSTVDRLIDQFPADRQEQIRVMLSESLKAVISQTLCRKIGGGRVAAREVLLSIPAVSNLIREGKTFQLPSVMQTSKRLGMNLLNDALIELVDQRIVEAKEAYIKATDKQSFIALLRSHNHDTSFLEGAGLQTGRETPPHGKSVAGTSPGAVSAKPTGRPAAKPAAKSGVPAR